MIAAITDSQTQPANKNRIYCKNTEYHAIDQYLTKILLLGERGALIWGEHYQESLMCQTAHTSLHKQSCPHPKQCKHVEVAVT